MERWYKPGKFYPKNIGMDGAYQRLSPTGKKIYRHLGTKSYLTKQQQRRRYVCITNQQIADHVKCCKRTVQYEIKKMLKSRLLIRWFMGCSGVRNVQAGSGPVRSLGAQAAGTGPQAPRYELPASSAQVILWRIKGSQKKVKTPE